MIRASRSASFNEPACAAESNETQHFISGQKTDARLSVCNTPNTVKTRSETADREKFEQMVVASRSRFLAIAYSILRNREDAEDALQNALLSGHLHLPNFAGRSSLSTWFSRIVSNAALMIRRKRKSAWMISQPESDSDEDPGGLQRIASAEPDPEFICAERETFQFVHGELQKLNPVLRQAFTLAYYDELSRSEACVLLGISPTAFKARVWRARKFLNQTERSRVMPIRRAWSRSPHSQVLRTVSEEV